VVDAVRLVPTQTAAKRPSRPADTRPATGVPMNVIQNTDIEVADATAQIERVHTKSFMEASLPAGAALVRSCRAVRLQATALRKADQRTLTVRSSRP
jgi:hypothetical protein